MDGRENRTDEEVGSVVERVSGLMAAPPAGRWCMGLTAGKSVVSTSGLWLTVDAKGPGSLLGGTEWKVVCFFNIVLWKISKIQKH